MTNNLIKWLIKLSNNKLDEEDITTGLVGGLVWGLGSLLSINMISFFKNIPTNYLALIITIIILTEIIFWLFDNKKPNPRENKFKFTLKRKFIALLKATFIFMQVIGSVETYKEVYPQLKQYFPEILKWIGYIGLGLIILAAIVLIGYFWIKLNEQKYKR